MLAREKSKVRSIYIYRERESSETIQNTLQQLEENNVTTVTEFILSQKLSFLHIRCIWKVKPLEFFGAFS